MDEFGDKLLDVLSNGANMALAARYQQPYELQKFKLEAIANGRMYPEGHPAYGVTAGGVNLTPWLLVGAVALVAVLALKG